MEGFGEVLFLFLFAVLTMALSMKRIETKQIRIGRLTIGGKDRVLIQSMCKHKKSNVEEIIKEINECKALGAKLMRVSILDEED